MGASDIEALGGLLYVPARIAQRLAEQAFLKLACGVLEARSFARLRRRALTREQVPPFDGDAAGPCGTDDRSLHRVLQLPNVAWPLRGHARMQRRGRESEPRKTMRLASSRGEELH